jgi:hypothetical protein
MRTAARGVRVRVLAEAQVRDRIALRELSAPHWNRMKSGAARAQVVFDLRPSLW